MRLSRRTAAVIVLLAAVAGTLLVQQLSDLEHVSWVWGIIAGFAALIPLLGGTDRGPQVDFAALVEQLAAAVREQWRTEERLRRIHDPWPLAVRFTATTLPIADYWAVINRDPRNPRPVFLGGRIDEFSAVFESVRSGRLVVLGPAGAGKSVLAVRFVVDGVERRAAGAPVPVLVSLASWDPRRASADDFILQTLGDSYPLLAGRHADALRLIREEQLILVLDGFDELAEDLRPLALASLNRDLGTHQRLVLTSRTEEYRTAVSEHDVITGSAVVELSPLAADEALRYLEHGTSPLRRARWEPVRTALTRQPDGELVAALSTPLNVSLARTVYAESDAQPAELLDRSRYPDRRHIELRLLAGFVPAALAAAPPGLGRAEDVQRWLGFLADDLDRHGTPDLLWWQLYRSTSRIGVGVMAGLHAGLVAAAGPIVLGLVLSTETLLLWPGIVVGVLVSFVAGIAATPPAPPRAASPPTLLSGPVAGLPSAPLIAVSIGAAACVVRDGVAGLVAAVLLSLAAASLLLAAVGYLPQGERLRAAYPSAWIALAAGSGGTILACVVALVLLTAVPSGTYLTEVTIGLAALAGVFGAAFLAGYLRRPRTRPAASPRRRWWTRAVAATAATGVGGLIYLRPATSAEFVATFLPQLGRSLPFTAALAVLGWSLGSSAAALGAAPRQPHRLTLGPRRLATAVAPRVAVGSAVGVLVGALLVFVADLLEGWSDFAANLNAMAPLGGGVAGAITARVHLARGIPVLDVLAYLWEGFTQSWDSDVLPGFGLVGAAVGLWSGIARWMKAPAETARAVTPEELLGADRAVVILPSLVVLAGVALVVVAGLAAIGDPTSPSTWSSAIGGLALAVTVAGIVGLRMARSAAWPRYVAARHWLALTRRVPWRLSAFLRHAHRAGILRRVGAAYQFRHLNLQAHLAREYRTDQRAGGRR